MCRAPDIAAARAVVANKSTLQSWYHSYLLTAPLLIVANHAPVRDTPLYAAVSVVTELLMVWLLLKYYYYDSIVINI